MSFCTYTNICAEKVLKTKLLDQRVLVILIDVVKPVCVGIEPNFTAIMSVSCKGLSGLHKSRVLCWFAFVFSLMTHPQYLQQWLTHRIIIVVEGKNAINLLDLCKSNSSVYLMVISVMYLTVVRNFVSVNCLLSIEKCF